MINYRFPVFRNGVTELVFLGFSQIISSNFVTFSS